MLVGRAGRMASVGASFGGVVIQHVRQGGVGRRPDCSAFGSHLDLWSGYDEECRVHGGVTDGQHVVLASFRVGIDSDVGLEGHAHPSGTGPVGS